MVEYGGVIVLEMDADGIAIDDTWFETAQEAFAVFNDVEWEEVSRPI